MVLLQNLDYIQNFLPAYQLPTVKMSLSLERIYLRLRAVTPPSLRGFSYLIPKKKLEITTQVIADQNSIPLKNDDCFPLDIKEYRYSSLLKEKSPIINKLDTVFTIEKLMKDNSGILSATGG